MTTKFRQAALGFIALGLFAGATAASASTLCTPPPAGGGATGGTQQFSGLGTASDGLATGTASPGLASAFVSAASGDSATANSEYNFCVAGPIGQVVTVDVYGSTIASASASLVGAAQAIATVYAAGHLISCAAAGTAAACPASLTTSFQVVSDTAINVSLAAGATTYSYAPTASATADPYIAVDPTTPDAAAYSIIVSPGVSNTPVPLPASTWLLLGGLGGLGAMVRRRAG